MSRGAQPSEHEQLMKQTEKWVSQTFFGTLLKQMHDSPFKSEMFDGGRGGQAFSALFDQRLAERMAHAAGPKLVRSIVRRIEARRAYGKSSLKDASPGVPREGHKHVAAAFRA